MMTSPVPRTHQRALVACTTLWFCMVIPCYADGPDNAPHAQSIANRLEQYATVRLTADMSALTARQRQMIPHLIQAARYMDGAFWRQAYGPKRELKSKLKDADAWRLTMINYGPWDRLAGNEPFLVGVGPKPLGARFYPADMTREKFEAYIAAHPDRKKELTSLYTMIQDDGEGGLRTVAYHDYFAQQVRYASEQLTQAASLADDPGLKKYLTLRSQALLDDNYRPSDMAWMDMKTNTLDIVIGPIETYEDQLFGYKASYEAYVLIKDQAWSKRLAHYAQFLPALQRELPVPAAYKQETPGTDSDLNAYDVIYYAGDCNAGSKTIAINLPNDEEVQLKKGARRLQLKNAMRAKYDKILVPIADMLIAPEQRKHVTFDAFFANTMFHEVAHGLGIKAILSGQGTVRQALRDQASALEEGKADVLGIYMATTLLEKNETTGGSVMDHYVTFMAGIFRSVRFGAASAHGRANMLRFNFFKKMGAFSRDSASGTYRVIESKMREAVRALSSKILRLQGDGDYDGVSSLMAEMGRIDSGLQFDLDRLSNGGIPVDIVFKQGLSELDLGD